jgi:hypothetical protein
MSLGDPTLSDLATTFTKIAEDPPNTSYTFGCVWVLHDDCYYVAALHSTRSGCHPQYTGQTIAQFHWRSVNILNKMQISCKLALPHVSRG